MRQDSDPARTLDALPRARERNEPATPLVDELWVRLVPSALVPDGTGAPRYAAELSLHPVEDHVLAARWLSLVKDEDVLSGVIHPSCLRRQRLPRLKELRSRSKQQLKGLDICTWLEAACTATVPDAKACLSLVAALGKSSQWRFLRERVRAAKMVLADTGNLVAAQDAVIDGATEDVDGVYRVRQYFIRQFLENRILASPITRCLRPASTRRKQRRPSYPVRCSARCATCKWSGADCAGPKNGGTETCEINHGSRQPGAIRGPARLPLFHAPLLVVVHSAHQKCHVDMNSFRCLET